MLVPNHVAVTMVVVIERAYFYRMTMVMIFVCDGERNERQECDGCCDDGFHMSSPKAAKGMCAENRALQGQDRMDR